MELTQSYLKSILNYNPDTGVFTWLPRPEGMFSTYKAYKTWNARYSGKEAGTGDSSGYRTISIRVTKRRVWQSHRLAFLYMTDSFPIEQCDHINGVRDDNRWCNLRDVSRWENQVNTKRHSTNTSGAAGVKWVEASNKWVAQITCKGVGIHIGSYDEFREARIARKAAEKVLGFHQNHGRSR